MITRVVFVIVPVEFVCGTVSVKPIENGLVSATSSVAVFDWSPVTVVSPRRAGRRLADDPGLRQALDAVVHAVQVAS